MPSGVKTNGIGKKTTAHLNLDVSLADAWNAPKIVLLTKPPAKRGRPKGPNKPKGRPYAGHEWLNKGEVSKEDKE